MTIVFIQIFHLLQLWFLKISIYPEFFIYPYLASLGWLPYSQIIDQHSPGLWLLPFNFFTLGFTSPQSYQILLILIIILISTQIYFLATKLFSKPIGLLSVLIFSLFQPIFNGNRLWPDTWLAVLTLPAFYFFQKKSWILTGFFLGIGLVFKQSLLPICLLVVWEIVKNPNRLKSLIDFAFGLVIPWVPIIWYFQTQSILPDFLYWTVWFNLTIYPHMAKLLPTLSQLVKICPVIIISLSSFGLFRKQYCISLIFWWGILSVIFGLSRFDLVHFQPLLPYFSILAGYLFYHLFTSKKYFILSLFIFGSLAIITIFWFKQPLNYTSDYFDSNMLTVSQAIKSQVVPGSKIYIAGGQPHLYYLSRTIPSGNRFIYQLPWYLTSSQATEILNLISDPPQLIIYDTQSRVDGKSYADYAPILLKYIQSVYQPGSLVGSYQFYFPPIPK